MPDRRITVAADSRVTMDELRREFPAEIDQFARLYRDVRALALKGSKSRIAPYLYTWRSAKHFLESYNLSAEAAAYFDVQSRFFFGRPVFELSLASFILMLDALPQAPRRVQPSCRSVAVHHRRAERACADERTMA